MFSPASACRTGATGVQVGWHLPFDANPPCSEVPVIDNQYLTTDQALCGYLNTADVGAAGRSQIVSVVCALLWDVWHNFVVHTIVRSIGGRETSE